MSARICASFALALMILAMPWRLNAQDDPEATPTLNEGESTESVSPRFVAPDGEVRVRGEYVDNQADFDDEGEDRTDFFSLRARLGLGVDLPDDVRVYIDLQINTLFGGVTDGLGSLAGLDSLSLLKLNQAYFELNQIGGQPLQLRLGRQELGAYGTELLVGDADFGPGLSFDALRLHYTRGDLTADYWWAIRGEHGHFDDDDSFFGAYHTFAPEEGSFGFDLYLVGLLNQPVALFDQQQDTLTAGVRLFGLVADGLDYSVEFAYQFGGFEETERNDEGGESTVEDLSLSAFAVEATVGYTLTDYSWEPRIGVSFYRSTGDGDPDDNQLETFNPMFQDDHPRFGFSDLFNGSNVQVITSSLTIQPDDDFEAGVNHVLASVVEVADTAPASLGFLGMAPDAGSALGMGIDLFGTYHYSSNVLFQLAGSLFLPGDNIEANLSEAELTGTDPAVRIYLHSQVVF
jgi:hypothetical protein